MQFGVQFFPIVGPDEKSAQDYFSESLTIAEEADTARLQPHPHRRALFRTLRRLQPEPDRVSVRAAQRTKRARLVTGAVLPVFNNPLKLAGELAMLDAISNGGSTSALRARSCRMNSAVLEFHPTNRMRVIAKAWNRSTCC